LCGALTDGGGACSTSSQTSEDRGGEGCGGPFGLQEDSGFLLRFGRRPPPGRGGAWPATTAHVNGELTLSQPQRWLIPGTAIPTKQDIGFNQSLSGVFFALDITEQLQKRQA